jgi:hypothetical protein
VHDRILAFAQVSRSLAPGISPTADASGGQTRQSAPEDQLFRTVSSLDSALLDAYNTCDVSTFASVLEEIVEFYHDRGGVTRPRQALVDSIRNNICVKS